MKFLVIKTVGFVIVSKNMKKKVGELDINKKIDTLQTTEIL